MSDDTKYASLELARVKMFFDVTMERLHETEESLTSTMRSFSLLKQKYDVDLKHHASSVMEELKERASEMDVLIQQGQDQLVAQISGNHAAALEAIRSHYNDIIFSETGYHKALKEVEDLKRQIRAESQDTVHLQDIVQASRDEYMRTLKETLQELKKAYDHNRNKTLSSLEETLRHIRLHDHMS